MTCRWPGHSSHAWPASLDEQSTYRKAWFNQAGVTAIDDLRFQPTLLTADPQGALEQAKQAAVDLAKAHSPVEGVSP